MFLSQLVASFLLAAAPVPEEKLDDGVYLLTFDGPGRKVKLTDGSDALLGKKLSGSIGTAVKVQSHTNDNSRFYIHIRGLGPLPKLATEVQTALVVDGVVLHVGRPEKLLEDGTADIGANVYSRDAAFKLANKYDVKPQLRKHPGHRVEVTWTPDRQQYEPGETITLTMELKNTGTEPLRFTHGGKQRGPRDNQFRFVAQEGFDGKGLPDTGNANNHGGICQSITLQPDEVYTAKVELTNWFTFKAENTYHITGVFEMPVLDAKAIDTFGPTIWDSLVVGECDVRVAGKKKN
jgi:hypothetical protein